MSGLSMYYQRAKGGLANINPAQAVELAEDWGIVGLTGLATGFLSASIGGLDKSFLGMNVPVDGAASIGIGLLSLSIRSPELRVASIALGGSASVRTFEKFFKKALSVNGEFDEDAAELGMGADYGYGYGYGAENDPLMEAAGYL